ncbi:MAG: tyrosine-type recombinase/integrase [Lachnospiraceae bacterium]
MKDITVLADGYSGIQKYMSSVDRPYDLAKRYLPACRSLEAFYLVKGQESYSSAMNAKYRVYIDHQIENGFFSERRGRLHRRLTFMLDDYYSSRPIQAIYTSGRGYKYKLDDTSELLVEKFKESLTLSANSIPSAGTIARSFFYYLQQNDLLASRIITADTIVNFLKFKSTESNSSMDNVLYFLRKLLLFLKDNRFEVAGSAVVSYKAAATRRKIFPALEHSDIEVFLNLPNRSTAIGKRNYAILLLASFTGIRAIDIANLTFENFRRTERAIVFVQHKTNHMNALPINQDVLLALDDYINNGRPESSLPYIFLTALRPYRKLHDHSSVKGIFDRYVRSCGIEKEAWDGKSFHAFRRTISKWLLESSADAQIISQILGQRDREVLKRYLPLAPNILRECSLDFTYVPLKSEVYR